MAGGLRVSLETALPSFSESEAVFRTVPAENDFVNELPCFTGSEKGMVGIGNDSNHFIWKGGVRMAVSRRDFFKLSGGGLAAGLGLSFAPLEAKAEELQIRYAKETTSICPYCAVGCGMIVHTLGGNIINIEGDPDHPINEGALCPKGSSAYQLRDNKARVTKPLYRAAGASEWKEVSWDWAIDEIARKVKKTRDTSFVATSRIKIKEKAGSVEVEKEIEAVVNRTMGMASVGSAAMDNEECYLYQKFLRGLGLVYIEHQARI